MAEVYTYAVCNISASTALPDKIFVVQDRTMFDSSATYHWERHARESIPGNYFLEFRILDSWLWASETLQSPLTRRGWIFQEQLLPRRTLFFGQRQISWECNSLRACQVYPGGLDINVTHIVPSLFTSSERQVMTTFENVRSTLIKAQVNLPGPLYNEVAMPCSYSLDSQDLKQYLTTWHTCVEI
jgi:hypothetical protein